MEPSLAAMDYGEYRRLEPQWDPALIACSIAICFIGSLTATQVFCHARMCLSFSGVFIWTGAGSLIFGFCAVWALHEIAMLACMLDVRIGVDAGLTCLSAVLAVFFTWIALASDVLWDRYLKLRRRKKRKQRKSASKQKSRRRFPDAERDHSSGTTPLIDPDDSPEEHRDHEDERGYFDGDDIEIRDRRPTAAFLTHASPASAPVSPGTTVQLKPPSGGFQYDDADPEQGLFSKRNGMSSASKAWLASGKTNDADESQEPSQRSPSEAGNTNTASSDWSSIRHNSSIGGSSSGYLNINSAMGMMYRKGSATGNAFIYIARALWVGCTFKNAAKGLFWSIAITAMHYCGIAGLRIPQGYYTLNPILVMISALVSWAVCFVGVILMSNMETQLSQQLLFSAVATVGVNGMHHSGMQAVTFWSRHEPSDFRGYPPALANSVIAVAGITCISANLLLTTSATVARLKLAEIVLARKELWKAIAQKENAEAAALARSEFIASASHEIRTPLHHLQGYSDLLAQTELTEEGRALLSSIQRATKTLSMITTNVLDWSKLERNAEATYRPTVIDIRSVCESIINLLPNLDDESNVELFMVVAPHVPSCLFLDETYIHRILMNLLSNALKFTRSGYVLLSIEISNEKLVAKVSDTGVGLEPEFRSRMFEPFQQGEVRGSQRGTGLGLSIIKQLLQRMQGTIDVESQFQTEDSEPYLRSGSTFTITLPLQTTSNGRDSPNISKRPDVAILVQEDDFVYSDGLRISWEKAGYNVCLAETIEELPKLQWKYVWADAMFLKKDMTQFHQLMQRVDWVVLVPSNSQDSLRELPGIQVASHMIVLQKPLMWHLFEKRVQQQQQRPINATPSKTLRFAPEVEVVPKPATLKEMPRLARKASRKAVILVIEDNPINQKLAKKMLAALGYDVLTADDGQAGVEEILKHDATVDAIIMDESMPRKSGTQATKEIREMEASGVLSRRRPIIAVTAVVNPTAQSNFLAVGADDFLAKPLSLTKLRDTLATHLARS